MTDNVLKSDVMFGKEEIVERVRACLRELIDACEGADGDYPEGSRYVRVSETLLKKMEDELYYVVRKEEVAKRKAIIDEMAAQRVCNQTITKPLIPVKQSPIDRLKKTWWGMWRVKV
jgi:hypothetical protein